MNVVWLEIISWVGTIAYGTHFYGKLVSGSYRPEQGEPERREVKILHKLTKSEAADLNKSNDILNYSFRYKPGQMVTNHWSEQQVIEGAINQWKKEFPYAKVLLKGTSGTYSPVSVLDGPEDFVKRGNEIEEGWHALGYYPRAEDEKPFEEAWDKLVKEYGIKLS